MTEYHKIQTVFKRDMESPRKSLILGAWTKPEFELLEDCRWLFTEKIDGTNVRIIWDGEFISYRGRTDRAILPIDLLKTLESTFKPLEPRLEGLFGKAPAVLYGEGYGGKIQKGERYRKESDFILFDIKIGRWWLKREDLTDIADKLNLSKVPDLGSGTLWGAIRSAREGVQSMFGNFEAEGYVLRPAVELLDRSGERIITKIKCRDFRP